MSTGRIIEGSEISSDVKESAEVCVIGSGAGGAVVAKELSERGHSVVLVEEGGRWSKENYPKDYLQVFFKMYRDAGATVCLGRPPIPMPIGLSLIHI